MVYGYARVSTTEQNLDRQLETLKPYNCDKIYCEKQSGKNFEDRKEYQKLKRKLSGGDLLIIMSIDRLGRNYEQILKEWKYLVDKGCDIQVLDMPILNTKNGVEGLDGKFISNLVLQILAYVSQKEREKIKERQRQGIDIAMSKGVKFGRPKKELPNNADEIIQRYIDGEINNQEAYKELGISRGQFYRILAKMDYVKKEYKYKPKRLTKADYVAMWQRHEITLAELREKTKLSDKEIIKLCKYTIPYTKKVAK